MSILQWSFYDLADGLFTGARYGGSVDLLADHTPEGCGAIAGAHNPDLWCVDTSTDEVIPREPIVPEDDGGEALGCTARALRNRLLAASDWRVTRAVEAGDTTPLDWQVYRQALRDVPQQEDFPYTIEWPEAPGA